MQDKQIRIHQLQNVINRRMIRCGTTYYRERVMHDRWTDCSGLGKIWLLRGTISLLKVKTMENPFQILCLTLFMRRLKDSRHGQNRIQFLKSLSPCNDTIHYFLRFYICESSYGCTEAIVVSRT